MAVKEKQPIDWVVAGKLLEAACSGVEVSSYFGIDEETLYNRCKTDLGMGFSEFKKQKKSTGEAALRAKQHQVALQGNTSMLVWMGKQRLTQKEPKQDHSFDLENGVIEIHRRPERHTK